MSAMSFLLIKISVAITLLGAGGGPANYTRMVNVANAVLYAYVVVSAPPRSLHGSRCCKAYSYVCVQGMVYYRLV